MLDTSDVDQFFKTPTVVVDKWRKTGLLEGLDSVKSEKIALLLENQARWFLRANEIIQKHFVGTAFPLIRRVYSNIDFDAVVMPVYIGKDGQARTTEEIETDCFLSSLSKSDLTGDMIGAEIEFVNKATDSLTLFFKQNYSKHKIILYTPLILSVPDESGAARISIRGNFLR